MTETPTRDLDSVATPAAIVDVLRVRENARRAVAYCAEHGLTWRPHIKTHKCRRVAMIQLEEGARGVTVATPREAEVMSTLTDDVLMAYPPVGGERINRLLELPTSVNIEVALDSREALRPLAEAAAAQQRTVSVLVEIDVGMGRVGLQSAAEALALAQVVDSSDGVHFGGILFYPGHARAPGATQDHAIEEISRRIRETVEMLASVGLSPATVSGGSTPTLWRSHEIPHLTEVRAGTWIFNDRDIVSMGVAEKDSLAYAVLATVVSTAVPGQAVVDAGSKALAKEVRGADDTSFGALLDRPEVEVTGLSEEHGILDLSRTTWRPTVGERVRIVPNHVCVSVNLQDRLMARDEDGSITPWELEGRGRARWTG